MFYKYQLRLQSSKAGIINICIFENELHIYTVLISDKRNSIKCHAYVSTSELVSPCAWNSMGREANMYITVPVLTYPKAFLAKALRIIWYYRRANNSRPVYFTVSAWEWVYATNLSHLQWETKERGRETRKRHVGEAHSVLITGIRLPQRLICYWGKTVSLRMLTNLRLADLRLRNRDPPATICRPTYSY
jgi:hypothetical protein